MVTNVEKRSTYDLLKRALNASFILFYLCILTDVFKKDFGDDISKMTMDSEVTFFGGLILRHQQLISSNVHCVMFKYDLVLLVLNLFLNNKII